MWLIPRELDQECKALERKAQEYCRGGLRGWIVTFPHQATQEAARARTTRSMGSLRLWISCPSR